MENKYKILIIDDTQINLQVVSEILLYNGYEVYTANSGELGLIETKRILPDLIPLDILMPGINGFDVLSGLKHNIDTCFIPIILLTAVEDFDIRSKGFEEGAVDYITKPFNEKDLISRIKIHLELINNRKKIINDEQLYAQLFELHTDSIFLIENETGQILKANNQASVLYGYSAEELIQLKNTDLSAEPDETRKITETTPIIKDNVVKIALRWHKKKDGTIFPVEISGRFFKWNNVKVHIAAVMDITERRSKEIYNNIHNKILGQLNSNNDNFINEILSTIKNELNVDAIAIKHNNSNNVITEFAHIGYNSNHVFDNVEVDFCVINYDCICGFIINKSKSNILSEFGSFYTNNIIDFIKSKKTATEDIKFKNTCINAGFNSLALIPIYNNENKKIGILQLNHKTVNFFNSDIIKMLEHVSQSISIALHKKEYIDKLKISETKFKNLVNNINEIIVIIDDENNLTFISNSILKLLGFQYKELLDKSILDIVYQEDVEAFKNHLNHLEYNRLSPTVVRFINKSGKLLWCRFSGCKSYLKSKEYEISGVISIIEESKQNEIKINNLKNEMEQIIYVTSHDLRSPLVNIHGFSNEIRKQLTKYQELIEKESDIVIIKNNFNNIYSSIAQFYNYIFPSITKINTLIDGLLSLSRVGKVEIKIENIDMNKLIKNILVVMDYKLKQNNIEIILQTLHNCSGDEKLINQLFPNLIDNAIKYSSNDKESFIKIYSKEFTDTVTYFIKDNGIGIDKNDIDKIFAIYFRSANISTGEGLGLTIVKKIIDKLEGSIDVKSEINKGSCFMVTLKK